MFEIKIAVDIVLAEDGLVDSSTMKGDAVHDRRVSRDNLDGTRAVGSD